MLNTVYQLKAPRQFDIAFREIALTGHPVIVRPTWLSICNADQRYYQGLRPREVLRKKLPMALIHEGIGEVVCDLTGTFQPGEAVVMIPNLPAEEDPFIAENYLRTSRFRGSGTDGFLQEYIASAPDRLVRLPAGLRPETAAFTELVSVSFHAIGRFLRFSHERREVIGVWGDGNLGYITALLLCRLLPESRILVFGKNPSKLMDFTFADEIRIVDEIPEHLLVDHAFECVGGTGAAGAVNQIIDHIRPEGTISILGVSEEPAPLNTRMILEKGLRLFGSSRSGREDFLALLALYEKEPAIPAYLENLIGQVVEVREMADLTRAFEIDIRKWFGKTILHWEI